MATWIIQSTNRRDEAIAQEVEALNKLGLKWRDFGVIPFTTELTNLDEEIEGPIVVRCGTKLIQMAQDDPGLWLGRGIFYKTLLFDQSWYCRIGGLSFLNSDAGFHFTNDFNILDNTFDIPLFIKPAQDLKAFTAGVLEAGQSPRKYIESQMHQPGAFDATIMLAGVKDVVDEYRFFVVDGKVVTGSQYRVHKKLEYKELSNSAHHLNAISFAVECASQYKPAKVFTLDVCMTGDGDHKIIEYNCFNGSGLYACDIPLLFKTIDEFVS